MNASDIENKINEQLPKLANLVSAHPELSEVLGLVGNLLDRYKGMAEKRTYFNENNKHEYDMSLNAEHVEQGARTYNHQQTIVVTEGRETTKFFTVGPRLTAINLDKVGGIIRSGDNLILLLDGNKVLISEQEAKRIRQKTKNYLV